MLHNRYRYAGILGTLVTGAITLVSGPGNSAVLSVGDASYSFGGTVCADVQAGALDPFTPVQAWACNAAPNQQFEFENFTIYTVGAQRCLDVFLAGRSAGTPVESYPCNGSVAQQWYYYDGEIYNPNSGMCLDAGNMANGTQLVIWPCNSSISQTWQIK